MIARRALLVALASATPLLAWATAAGAAPPRISAPSAILVEPETGDVVYARRALQRRPIASTTKLMTALLLIERRRPSDVLLVRPYAALPAESVAGLRAGERLTAADMLRALLLASANDAASSIAIDLAGSKSRFVALMNARARRAGLSGSHYANPIGLDAPGNFSTATDLVKLALLVRRDQIARAVMDRPRATLRSGDHPRTLVNRNTLIAFEPWMDGVKTGHTQTAGYVLVGSATRGGVRLLSAVLGEPSEGARNADTLALMRYGFGRYLRLHPVVPRRVLVRLPVRGSSVRVAVAAARGASAVVRRGEHLQRRLIGLPRELEGPLAAGATVGQAVVRRRGRVVARVPLVTLEAAPRASLSARLWSALRVPVGVVAALGLAATAAVTLDRARRRRRGSGGHA